MKTLYAVVFLLISYCSLSQRLAQKMADQFFDNLSYASAVDYYKDLSKGKAPLETNLRRLGICYYKLQEYKKGEEAYAKLVSVYPNAATAEDFANYIQCLKNQEKYAEVKPMMEKLALKNPQSRIVELHKANQEYFKTLKLDSAKYKVTNVNDVNTVYSEFFPYMDKKTNSMLFVSNRRNVAVKNKTFAFDDTYFTDTYIAEQKDSLRFKDAENLPKQFFTNYHDGPVIVSRDEKTMYLTRTNYISKKSGSTTKQIANLKLLMFKKDSEGNWDNGTALPFCSDDYSVGHAALTADGKRMYFISDMPGGLGQSDVWYTDIVNGEWQKPVNAGRGINTEGQEMFPFLNQEGILFFASNGYAGLGGLDVCYAFPNGNTFMNGAVLGYPINTRFDDFGFYVNSDLKTGYFSSNRDGGKGKDDIYYFRSFLPLFGTSISGNVINAYSKKLIPGSKVFLLDERNTRIDSVIANKDGSYQLNAPDLLKNYSLEVKESDQHSLQQIAVKNIKPGKNNYDILLYPKYTLLGTVTDGKSNEALDSVKITITHKEPQKQEDLLTNREGKFKNGIKDKKAGDKLDVVVKMEKRGYITSVQNMDLLLDTNTLIYVNNHINTRLEKMQKGTDIGKIVKINPIYFDYGKFTIKPEAAIELDKIVAVMNENPTMKIELGSHTDCRSGKAYNMQLSDKRAKASANYVISKGIDKTRIYGKGYGETKLINNCECEGAKVVPCTEEQHQQNRRTEFIVVKF